MVVKVVMELIAILIMLLLIKVLTGENYVFLLDHVIHLLDGLQLKMVKLNLIVLIIIIILMY